MPSTTADRQSSGDAKAAAAERRRTNKPIMEKKRRQRINDSLNQLKTLVLEALKKDPSRYNKLEKADILEMTVRHVQALHRHQSSSSSTPHRHASGDPAAKYRAGFNHCASEVSTFLERDNTLSGEQRSRILLHLSESLAGFRGGVNTSPSSQSPPHRPPPPPPASAVVVDTLPRTTAIAPAAVASSSSPRANTPIAEVLHGHQQPSFATDSLVMRGVSLVPARLFTGQMAYILPNGVTGVVSAAATTAVATAAGDYHHHHHHQVPLSPPPSVASPSLSLASSPPASPCRSPSPQPLDLAPIRHPEDDCCWRPW